MKIEAIFGPPGTGKSHTLLERLEAESGTPALALSHSKAAASELTSRLPEGADVKPSTIHALTFQALGMNRAQVVDKKKLVDYSDVSGVPFKTDFDDELQEGDEYTSVLSYSKARKIDPMEAYTHYGAPGTHERFEYFLKTYPKWKKSYGYCDFDDMLNRFLDPSVSFECPPVVAIDEAQDCSPLQWDVIAKICRHADKVYVAGDDDQAIHEWSGADPHGMIDFMERGKGKMTVLDQSFRVPRSVLALAKDAALSGIEKRVEKEFKPRDAEGKVTRYGSPMDINLSKLYKTGGGMILARDRWQLDDIRRMINRSMIPYIGWGIASPWTSRIAQALKRGEKPEIPPHWQDFYAQADLSLPINITLSTIHQAKGKESHRVILNLNLPTRALSALYQDRDAELRVLYVGLTRTSDKLILCGESPLL